MVGKLLIYDLLAMVCVLEKKGVSNFYKIITTRTSTPE